MKKSLRVAFLLFVVLSIVSAQDFSGGFMKHLQTGTLTAFVDDAAASVTKVNSSYSALFPRDNIFDDTDTTFFIGTSLRDYHINTIRFSAGTNPAAAHIQVLNPRLNPGKNIFTITINTEPAVINPQPSRVEVFEVRLYYIIVGSGFEGYYNDVQSSYLFARNGKMDVVDNGDYDFQNTYQPSPFNYQYDPEIHKGCGIVQRNGVWILEYGLGCQYLRLMVFITGFQRTHLDSTNPPTQQINFVITPGTLQFLETQQNNYDTQILDSDSVEDGLPITITGAQTGIDRIQLSLVAFSLREYDAGSYPTQIIFPNTFKINTLMSDAYAFNFAGLPGTSITSSPANVALFYAATPSQVSHLFCGDLQQVIATAGITVTQIDISLQDPIFSSGSSSITATASQTTFDTTFLRSCVMITGVVDVCNQNVQVPPIDTSVQFVATVQPEQNVGTQFLTSLPTVSLVYSQDNDPNYISELAGNLLVIQQQFTVPGTNTYKFNYGPNIDAGKAYEGVFHLTINSADLRPGGTRYTFTLKIEIFGNVVYRGTNFIQGGSNLNIHFGFINLANANSDVILTFSTNYNDDNGVTNQFLNFIQFGFVQHNTVINQDNECVATCDPIQSATTVSIGIDFSSVPPKCITCNSNLNLVFRPDLGSCGCGIGQVQNNGVCQPCGIILCATCNPNKDQCIMCAENSNFINSAVPGQGCVCNSRFYRSDLQCLQCPFGCVQCTNPTTCSACVDNNNTRASNDTGCGCLPGFYEANTNVCPKCSPQCLTCTESATNCLTCDTTKNFMMQGSTCICQAGYFKVVHSNNTATCQPCSPQCKTCADRADNCLACQPFRVRGSDGRCQCQSGYVQFMDMCVDTLCSSIPYCQSCLILVATGQPACTACTDLRVPSDDKTSCICKQGYFQQGGQCEKCGQGCKRCKSATECLQCAAQAYPIGDGTCQCPRSNYIAEMNHQLMCLLCDANCLICQESPSNCIECQNGFISIDRKCVCPDRFYPTIDRFECLQCGRGCASCASGDKCDTCQPGYTPSDNACVLSCPTGTFNAGDKCQQCSEHCSHCTSSISCSGCFAGYKLFAGSCRQTCPASTFELGALCVACRQPCGTCMNSAFNCLTCIDGYFMSQGQCVSDCPQRHYFDGQTCASCSSNCFNCHQNPQNCISCPDGKFLVEGKCLDSCPYVVIDGLCTSNCPQNYYLSGKTCRPCEGNCATCSSASKCNSCINNLLVYKGQCVAQCPTNAMKISNYCVDCDPSCIGCSGSPFSCFKCANGYYQFQERCVRECPKGYYLDYNSNSCRQCDAGCAQCLKAGQCIKCDNNQTPIGGICPNTCGANCWKCQSEKCTHCAEGYIISQGKCINFCPSGSKVIDGKCVCNSGYLYQNRCVNTCPNGFVNQGKDCIPCRQPCVSCSGSATQCTTCKDGYILDQVTKRCVINVECPYGYSPSNFGGCILICPIGYYFHDSTCYQHGCPLGYVPNQQSRSCQKQDIPTGCTFPYYLQGSSCVNSCQPGFYPNPVNRICESCPPNCYTCNQDKVCASCVAGFILKDQICVATINCPTGYYRYNDNCVSRCPVGTTAENNFCTRQCRADSFFYNSRCYSQCPTLYKTADACVDRCPSNYVLNGDLCVPPSVNCASNQYYDSVNNNCYNCRQPCATCTGAANKCLSCINNYYLADYSCFPKSNVICPQKCSVCEQPNKCAGCAQGYVNTGDDCVKNKNVLQNIQLQQVSKSIRGNTVFIKIRPTVVPNGLPSSIASNFFIFNPKTANVSPIINQWISGTEVYVALTHSSTFSSYQAFLIINANILSEMYLSMGYTLANSYLSVDISRNLPQAPSSLNIPVTSNSIGSQKNNQSKLSYSLTLNSVVNRALNF